MALNPFEQACARVLRFAQDCNQRAVYEDSVLMTNPVAVADLLCIAKEGPELYAELKRRRSSRRGVKP